MSLYNNEQRGIGCVCGQFTADLKPAFCPIHSITGITASNSSTAFIINSNKG